MALNATIGGPVALRASLPAAPVPHTTPTAASGTGRAVVVLRAQCHSCGIADEEGLRPTLTADRERASGGALDVHAVMDALPDVVLVADRDMRVVMANQAARQFFGLAPVGRPLTDLMPERLRAAHIAGFNRFLSTGRARFLGGPPLRVAALGAGGHEVEVDLHLGVLGQPDDPDVLLVACIQDVGERVALEQEVVTSHYVRAVLRAAYRLQDAADVDGVVHDILPALCTELQWDFAAIWLVDEVENKLRCMDTWLADDAGLHGFDAASRATLLARGQDLPGETWEGEVTVMVRDITGRRHWTRHAESREAGLRTAVAFPVVGRKGVLGVVELLARTLPPVTPELEDLLSTVGRQAGAFLDRLRAEEQTRRSEQELRYRAALLSAQIASAPQGVLAVSQDRRVIACNRRFEELWKLPPGSIKVGDPSPARQPTTLRQVRDPEEFERRLRWGHEHPGEIQHLEVPLVDGRVIEGLSSPIVDEDGTYHGRIWFLNDDTERRQVEAERSELLARLQTAQRSQAFLLEAARVLARASGYEETLERLAAVAVPTLGDICLIDVVAEDGSLRRAAARHADPQRQPLVDELRRRFPPQAGSVHPSADVTRSRRSRWSAHMTEEFLRATCRDDEHFGIVKSLGFTSYISVPLAADDEVLGALTLVTAGSDRRFGPEDAALAEDLADQVAQVVAKAHRYDQEHRVAHTLQANLLPLHIPQIPGISLALRYAASPRADEVGGDWFDVQALDSGEVRVAVGDVAGHDVGAAAAMGQLRSACRALTPHAANPFELVEQLRAGWEHLDMDRIATLVVAQLDPATGSMQIASAGHPPPLFVGPRRATYLDLRPGPPLGAPHGPTPTWRGTLATDTVMLLYTDGLVEDRHTELGPGMRRLAEVAGGLTSPEELCDHVLAALAGEPSDDVALVALARQRD